MTDDLTADVAALAARAAAGIHPLAATEIALLQRAAYGPDASSDTRAAAEAALAGMARSAPLPAQTPPSPSTHDFETAPATVVADPARPDIEHPEFVLPQAPHTPRFAAAVAVIATAMVAAFGGASAVASIPEDSLAIFDRPQNARDLAVAARAYWLTDVDPESVRLLVDLKGGSVAVARESHGWICVHETLEGGAAGQCISEAQFRRSGLQGGGGSAGSFYWGPTGEPRVYFESAARLDELGLELLRNADPYASFAPEDIYRHYVEDMIPCLGRIGYGVGGVPTEAEYLAQFADGGRWNPLHYAVSASSQAGSVPNYIGIAATCPDIIDLP